MKVLAFFVPLFASALAFGFEDRNGTEFFNRGVYKITSRLHPDAVLSVNGTQDPSSPVNTETYGEEAGQKWRMVKSLIHNAYELFPTLNEDYVLEYVSEGNIFQRLYAWSWGNNKLWEIIDVGDGYRRVKNYQNELCIKTEGVGVNVTAVKCDNSKAQQWKFEKL